jgi:hypothetical protein
VLLVLLSGPSAGGRVVAPSAVAQVPIGAHRVQAFGVVVSTVQRHSFQMLTSKVNPSMEFMVQVRGTVQARVHVLNLWVLLLAAGDSVAVRSGCQAKPWQPLRLSLPGAPSTHECGELGHPPGARLPAAGELPQETRTIPGGIPARLHG